MSLCESIPNSLVGISWFGSAGWDQLVWISWFRISSFDSRWFGGLEVWRSLLAAGLQLTR